MKHLGGKTKKFPLRWIVSSLEDKTVIVVFQSIRKFEILI